VLLILSSTQIKTTMRYLTLFILFTAHVATAQTRTLRTYDGTVNDKYPVSLTLTTYDNLAYGTLAYKRTGLPIRVVGSLEGENLLLHEFDSKATISGIFNGKASAKGYLGTWFPAKAKAKELTFSLTQTSKQPAPAPPAFNLTGTYGYNFGKEEEAPAGQLLVQQIGADKIVIAMDANRGAPSYNMATIEKTTLKLRGNQAIYSNKEYGKCTIKLTFFEGGASIVYVGEDYNCGFGNAATVTGNYLKTSSKTPTFPKLD
jgi:hypothetical protein